MTYEDYLQHWGILGQKWGQKNGPPYPLSLAKMNSAERRLAKQERYEKKTADLKKKIEYQQSKIDYKKAKRELAEKKKETKQKPKKEEKEVDSRKLLKKPIKSLSDKQLDSALDRANKENKLRAANSSSIASGGRFVKAMLALGGSTAISSFVTKISKGLGEGKAQVFVDSIKKAWEEDDKTKEKNKDKKDE